MSLKTIFLAGVSAAALATVSVPSVANATTISANTWYTVGFGTSDGINAAAGESLGAIAPLSFGTGIAGPILPSGTADASALTATSWVITAPNGGYITITDGESSGDQFQLTDNGSFMTSTGTTPLGGQVGLSSGLTSTPTVGTNTAAENIGSALGNAAYSSGTFALVAGDNVISATLYATTENASAGDANFIVQLNAAPTDVPEPASLALIGVGIAGVAAARRRRAAKA
ncbi:MAG TPA: hypothetical protein DDZ81_05960 [Acetobacteraceae bacterium]|jgi:hypothetical protein|nr:hypothetical protein [Acetobacteraceae bacterium]